MNNERPENLPEFMELGEAVERFVKNGAQVALGGFTVTRNPMAAVYEMVRQGVRDLHLVCHSNGQSLDLLIGAGCVKRLEIAYGGNGRFAPTCIRFREAIERRTIEWEDYSNYQMSLRFLAGSLGVPFMPVRSGLGSDLLAEEGFSRETRKKTGVAAKKFVLLQDPFSDVDDKVVLVPALTPDVTLLHVQYVGEDGTVQIKGLSFADVEQAKAADAVIVTCEEIIPVSEIRRDPSHNALPPFFVDAVVCVPYGAHPTGCFGFYDYDPGHLNLYSQAARDDTLFDRYLDDWVYNVGSREEYLAKVGREGLDRIKADPHFGYAPGLDRKGSL